MTHTYKNKLGNDVKCYIEKNYGEWCIVRNQNGVGVYLRVNRLSLIQTAPHNPQTK
jgi:hypothetical protein